VLAHDSLGLLTGVAKDRLSEAESRWCSLAGSWCEWLHVAMQMQISRRYGGDMAGLRFRAHDLLSTILSRLTSIN
jgi:hypothetical protein